MNKTKVCPNCGRMYEELKNYCSKCGYKLEKALNMCSELKTTMCEHTVLADDDLFCPYCGAKSTYSIER